MMKFALALAICLGCSAPAFASCKSDAADKKLAGAALTSFMTKCEKDAAAACEADSAKQKLVGAAKISHVTKCVAEKVGAGVTTVDGDLQGGSDGKEARGRGAHQLHGQVREGCDGCL